MKSPRKDVHALDENGMVACNPRDREAAHRAQVEGIAVEPDATGAARVTCRACRRLLPRLAERRARERAR